VSDAELAARFEALQRKLVPLWASIQTITQDPQTIVVVPSITIDSTIRGARQQAYEERFLFLLLLLRQPRARLVYVTSQAIHADIIDYYLDLLPGVLSSHAKERLFLVSPLDGSSRPLTQKLLERPRLIQQIRALIPDLDRAHLVPFNTTTLERDLALALGIPMYGADPKHTWLGGKSGARRIFAEEGVSHPLGVEDLHSAADLAEAIVEMRGRKPSIGKVVVKLNEGVSGEGNAHLDLDGLPAAPSVDAVAQRLQTLRFESSEMSLDTFVARLAGGGGIVEERIAGTDFRSPSAQLRVTPLGQVEALSTHDQVLGGPTGQSYLGCRFPADVEYGSAIMHEAMKVGRRLMREGVLGRFALDFVTVRNARGQWEVYAIEINLRKGGTTHPFLTLQFLTDGSYDAETGVFLTPLGEPKCFIASDHVESPRYRVFTHHDLFDIVARHGLHFDQTRQKGVVFHMMNAIGENGLVGLTAVGNTHEEASAIYDRAVKALDDESQSA
jgi:PGM1 C-terminal domain